MEPEIKPELTDQIGQLMHRAGEIAELIKDDQGDRAALKAELDVLGAKMATLDEERTKAEAVAAQKAEIKAQVEAILSMQRTPSKADLIGTMRPEAVTDQHEFFASVAMANSRDYETQTIGKARLAEMGSAFASPDAASKATVGDTTAAGGFLVPNNVVMDINRQAAPQRAVVDLFTVIDGVRGAGVSIPWESALDSRAVIAAAGATKENSNFITNNYSATLYTLARIFDVGNQLLRQSEGAAEKLVRSKLSRAFAVGEDYYALQGTGTAQPYGLLTALGTTGTYVTSFTASATTLAGSSAAAIAKATGALANRGAIPDGVVVNASDFWIMAAQGTDSAGFFFNPAVGPGGIDPTRGELRVFGLPVRATPNMPTDSMVVGEYKAAMFFRGQGYRVDVSTEAGTRWDTNLTGFRGEEEIAFDARPTVYTGHFQRITDFTP